MREFKDATSSVQREIEESMKDPAPKKTVPKPTPTPTPAPEAQPREEQ